MDTLLVQGAPLIAPSTLLLLLARGRFAGFNSEDNTVAGRAQPGCPGSFQTWLGHLTSCVALGNCSQCGLGQWLSVPHFACL